MFSALRALFQRDRLHRELLEEMEDHVERETARQMSRGLDPEAAAAAARRAFGNLTSLAESGREAWGWSWLDQLGQDLRYGVRALRRTPGFTLVAVVSLALGIGSNTAVYSLVYDILLQPLAVTRPEQLAVVEQTRHGEATRQFSLRQLQELRQAAPGVTMTGLGDADNSPLTVGTTESFVNVEFADETFAVTIGPPVLRGRLITADDVIRHAPVAIVSARLATSRFGGVDSAVGRRVQLRGHPVTVVGVMSREYRGLQYPGYFEMAVPSSLTGDLGLPDPRLDSNQTFTVVARAGAPKGWSAIADRLSAALRACCRLETSDHITLEPMTGGIAGGKDDVRGQLAPMLYALLGCVGIVLLIA